MVAEALPEPAGADKHADADRRTVTVLFADLCNFTTLSEQTDPELLQTLQNELFEELTGAVTTFGGFVDKFIGDALLALFGAPQAHEDDPERALHSALEMTRRVARIAERWRDRVSLPLALHIGVNTGPVVAGGVGAGNIKAYSVTGDTVNTAQRLQSMAEPGDILVGPVTHRLTRHAFSFSLARHAAIARQDRGRAGASADRPHRGRSQPARTVHPRAQRADGWSRCGTREPAALPRCRLRRSYAVRAPDS